MNRWALTVQTFGSYKLWGLGLNNGKSHKLKLPNCRYMGLWRADDIDSLDLIAPKLERLDLQVHTWPAQLAFVLQLLCWEFGRCTGACGL